MIDKFIEADNQATSVRALKSFIRDIADEQEPCTAAMIVTCRYEHDIVREPATVNISFSGDSGVLEVGDCFNLKQLGFPLVFSTTDSFMKVRVDGTLLIIGQRTAIGDYLVTIEKTGSFKSQISINQVYL